MKSLFYLSIAILISAYSSQTLAEKNSIDAFHRLAVFPVLSSDIPEGLRSSLWWQIRKDLSTDLRFLLASKDFLKTKEVYQARGKLETTDVILLAKHLDADAILTIEYKNRTLTLRSYSAKDGMLISELSESIHSSFTVESKLLLLSKKIVQKWQSLLPYQAYVSSRDNKLLELEIGSSYSIDLLKEAYLVEIKRSSLGELVKGNYEKTILRKLELVDIKDNKATFKELPGKLPYKQKNKQLVHLPELEKKNASSYLGRGQLVQTDKLLPELRKSGKTEEKDGSYYAKVVAVINILLIVVLSL